MALTGEHGPNTSVISWHQGCRGGDSAICQTTERGAGAGSKQGAESGFGFAREHPRDILVAELLLGPGLGRRRNL